MRLVFFVHIHKEIETKRDELILFRALGQSGPHVSYVTVLLTSQATAPQKVVPTTGQSAAPFPALWGDFFFFLNFILVFFFNFILAFFLLVYKCLYVYVNDVFVFLLSTHLLVKWFW